MKKLTIIIAALGLLAACNKQADELASPSSNQNNSTGLRTTRPFQATLSAVVDVNSTNPPTPCSDVVPVAAPDFVLSGNATHLGLINAQLSSLHHELCNLDLATALLTTHVSVDLVAADGSVIHISGDDVVNVAALLTGAPNPTGSITGTWTVTGGTGRFNGATGSLTINGTVDLAANTFTCNCVGTINY